jgi:uncharacterized glyoxalase superfamily protein PhnB
MTDPFDQLAAPLEPHAPRPSFARALRARLVEALELDPITTTPTIDLPGRKPMPTTTPAADHPDGGFQIEQGPRAGQRYVDGIWSVMTYADVDAGIRFVTEVLGFEELVMVRGPEGEIRHSEFRWPEGGIVQLASPHPDNPFLTEPGKNSSLYVITQDPQAVWERCQAAGVEVIRAPEEPHYDPGGMGFSVRDPEGNAWSFGRYSGGATE